MYWTDSHCHINDEAFKDDLDDVLNNMLVNDVKQAMIISSYIKDFYYGLDIKKDGIDFKHSLGIYPGDVDDVDDNLFCEFAKLFEDDRCDAIGEIGLDYHWNKENKDKQIEIFKRQIDIAIRINKPIIVHARDAIQDTFDIMKENKCRGVLHCYSGSSEMAKEFIKLGYYISISGTITWKNARQVLEVIRVVPLDKLLIETDCPYLTPAPNRGKRNEPSYVVYTGKKICEELNIDEEVFKKQISENYHKLFDKI